MGRGRGAGGNQALLRCVGCGTPMNRQDADFPNRSCPVLTPEMLEQPNFNAVRKKKMNRDQLSLSQIAKLQHIELELKRVAEVLDSDHEANRLYAEAVALRNLAEDIRFYILKDVEIPG